MKYWIQFWLEMPIKGAGHSTPEGWIWSFWNMSQQNVTTENCQTRFHRQQTHFSDRVPF